MLEPSPTSIPIIVATKKTTVALVAKSGPPLFRDYGHTTTDITAHRMLAFKITKVTQKITNPMPMPANTVARIQVCLWRANLAWSSIVAGILRKEYPRNAITALLTKTLKYFCEISSQNKCAT